MIKLDLSHNYIGDDFIASRVLGRYNALTSLNMSHNNLSIFQLSREKKMSQNLKSLDLSFNHLENLGTIGLWREQIKRKGLFKGGTGINMTGRRKPSKKLDFSDQPKSGRVRSILTSFGQS